MPVQLAIYSPADRLQPHRFKADESYEVRAIRCSCFHCSRLYKQQILVTLAISVQVGGPKMSPVACYLDVEGIIQLAKEQNVDAIHPGYKFAPCCLPHWAFWGLR